MKNESKLKKFIASIKSKKHLEVWIAVIAVVLMLVLYFSARGGKTQKTVAATSSSQDYCKKTEAELVTALEAMQGVGKVKAVISWESGVEKIIAYATNSSGSNISTTPTVIQQNGQSAPIVLKELYPKALGVVIICQGGNNVAIQLDVIRAVSVMLDIEQSKVNVYAMKQ